MKVYVSKNNREFGFPKCKKRARKVLRRQTRENDTAKDDSY